MDKYGLFAATKSNSPLTQIPNRLSYSSDFSSLKIFKKQHVNITTNGSGSGTGRVQHGLGYTPTFYSFRKGTASNSFLDATSYPNAYFPMPGTFNPWIARHETSDTYADSTYLTNYIEGSAASSYSFLNYLFVDQSQYNNAGGPQPSDQFGLKITRDGIDADGAHQQQLAFNSSFRPLNYYRELTTDYPNLTLPAISGDFFDTNPQEGTYVDFYHNLGYAPFFLAYSDSSGVIGQIPDVFVSDATSRVGYYALTAWCDAQRIRITFYRKAHYTGGLGAFNWSAGSVNVKVYIFNENLSLE